MAVSEVESVDSISYRLRDLLAHARRLKSSTSIDPRLPVSDLFQEAGQPKVRSHPVLAKGILEAAARKIFYGILDEYDIEEPEFVQMWNLLDILQHYEDIGQSSPALVLWLLEEMLDSQNIEACRRVFDYMESRREILIASNFSRNKDLVILRSCNELLRRLSRAEDAVFCGRVFIFMFLSFPLGDKSSVNPRGDFHVENVTTFADSPSGVSNGEPDEMDVDGTEVTETQVTVNVQSDDAETNTSANPDEKVVQKKTPTSQVDIDTLYPIFWSLQQAFSNPTRLFSQEAFDEFKKGLEMTLQKFKEIPTVISGEKLGVGRGLASSSDDFASTFNPKYLTSRDLFKLELSDLAFQRHILVQSLILIDFLLSLTEASKSKLAPITTQKALRYTFTVSEHDAGWALGIKRAIVNYLQEGPEGKFYHRMVEVVLSRDKNWVQWKLENCPEIKRAPVPADVFQESKSGAQKTCAGRVMRAAPMGSLSLAFLSDSDATDGMEGLRNGDRTVVPTPESFIHGIQGDDLDLEMATEDEKESLHTAKTSKTWRALRISSRDKLSRFDQIDDGKNIQKLTQVEPSAEPHAELSNVTEQGEAGSGPVELTTESSVTEKGEKVQGTPPLEEQRAGSSDQVTTAASEGTG
ncbi:hypothetical protein EJ05DRAFT_253689 [Pseudovirgaria hyperparasitica]|uniref:Nuclear matrix protein n=1 Tax=Pseudovirgaria hyperparasitica TaxID=470096 RepID=A0A6A6WE78_9PEZI|nr:uncharacterized protein EJ05DRAFT_253689 [Pseudovirgaria hyperparasitica]KAF2761128.1 hypothetical protein EJ05DRAFT_253689 [Pseudovirgaria hyperparasitica]